MPPKPAQELPKSIPEAVGTISTASWRAPSPATQSKRQGSPFNEPSWTTRGTPKRGWLHLWVSVSSPSCPDLPSFLFYHSGSFENRKLFLLLNDHFHVLWNLTEENYRALQQTLSGSESASIQDIYLVWKADLFLDTYTQ